MTPDEIDFQSKLTQLNKHIVQSGKGATIAMDDFLVMADFQPISKSSLSDMETVLAKVTGKLVASRALWMTYLANIGCFTRDASLIALNLNRLLPKLELQPAPFTMRNQQMERVVQFIYRIHNDVDFMLLEAEQTQGIEGRLKAHFLAILEDNELLTENVILATQRFGEECRLYVDQYLDSGHDPFQTDSIFQDENIVMDVRAYAENRYLNTKEKQDNVTPETNTTSSFVL